jgi:ParB/RepB/Spo0J family partition protein
MSDGGVKIARNTVLIPIDLIKIGTRARGDKGDIESLAERIKEKGLIQPITIDQDYKLIAGERRLLAHQLLGHDKIEAIIRKTKDQIDLQEVELIENIARKDMTWQEVALAERALFELKSKTGKWSQKKQAEMLNGSQASTSRMIEMAEALETIPELANYKTFDEAYKDLKKLQEEVIIQHLSKKAQADPLLSAAAKWAKDHYKVGDAFKGMEGVRDNLAHFAEVDPPYAVELDKRKSRNSKKNMEEYNEVDPDEYINFYERTAKDVFRILRADSFAIFWFGWDWFGDIRNILLEAGFKVPTIPAIWTKGNSGQTASPDTTLASCHEPFWLARKGKPKLARPGRSNVFAFDPVPAQKKIHPTERPIALMEEILGTVLFPGSTVMVPFLGSGVTLRAAYKLTHTGFGWDLSDENKKRFLARMEEDAQPDGDDGD